ncbi:MAG: hypothetical protein CMJ58_15230 [Planctomycetaceae bacterium]|nr:hypothetical protein [Planctomycetaceae bacterium]
MAKSKRGRKKGSRNLGFFYRSGRGWCATEGKRSVPLCDAEGQPLRDPATPTKVVSEAYARYLHEKNQQPDGPQNSAESRPPVTVLQVCQAYLANAKATGSERTHEARADTLFDLCFGLPPEFRDKGKGDAAPLTTDRKKQMAAKRIHPGYGQMLVTDFKPLHVDQWLNSHATWKGGRRSRIQALKRALNYCVEADLIAVNPIKGYATPKPISRVTYITAEQESALLDLANSAIRVAIKICIRTGARPGCEFAALERRHVSIENSCQGGSEMDRRMQWCFKEDESKTGKLRVLRIRDPEVIDLVEAALAKRSTGPLFRNTKGRPWTRESLSLGFRNLRKRLAQRGVELDDDACMYSCRHTYAKRVLQGYWTGKATNIETLARLMGNSPQVCRDHYLQWCDHFSEPLWDAC